jgi:hypothetical protein
MALNHMVKKSAVKKYSTVEGTPEEIKAAIAADEKGYTEEEAEEIFAALEPPAPTLVMQEMAVNPFGKKTYQEWEVKIEQGKAKKLAISRPKVKITDDQADILNRGVIEGPNNTYAKMYFLPE